MKKVLSFKQRAKVLLRGRESGKGAVRRGSGFMETGEKGSLFGMGGGRRSFPSSNHRGSGGASEARGSRPRVKTVTVRQEEMLEEESLRSLRREGKKIRG